MNIEKLFSKDETMRLLILAYIGEWVMTAHYEEGVRPEYTDILNKMLRLAHQMGLDEYVSWRDTMSKAEPSFLLEREGRRFLDEYGDKFFIDELAERLSKIDIETLIRYAKENPVKKSDGLIDT